MSQPRRRRRRGRRGGGDQGGSQGQPREQAQRPQPGQNQPSGDGAPRRRKRKRRRGRGSSGAPRDDIPSPKYSEQLFGLLVGGEPPTTLTAEPDGTILEDVIGDLQTSWGVPQYPQEYRITIRVAETRDKAASNGGNAPTEERADRPDRGPKREKAPSPARLAAQSGREPSGDQPRKRRRRRGRRRKGGGGPSTGGSPSSGDSPSGGSNPSS